MRLSVVFELLLIFLLIAFAASRVIDSAEERRGLVNGYSSSFREARQEGAPSKYCSCNAISCNCCRNFSIPVVPLRGPGCATISYLRDDAVSISMTFGDRVLRNITVSGKSPQPVCMNLPGGLSKFCGRIYNIKRDGDQFKACLGLELRSLDDVEAALRVSCFRFGSQGLRVEPGQPVPADEKLDEDDDDDDYGLSVDDDDDDDEDDDDDFGLSVGDDDDDDDVVEDESDNDVDSSDDYTGFGALSDEFLGFFGSDSSSNKKKRKPVVSEQAVKPVPLQPAVVQQAAVRPNLPAAASPVKAKPTKFVTPRPVRVKPTTARVPTRPVKPLAAPAHSVPHFEEVHTPLAATAITIPAAQSTQKVKVKKPYKPQENGVAQVRPTTAATLPVKHQAVKVRVTTAKPIIPMTPVTNSNKVNTNKNKIVKPAAANKPVVVEKVKPTVEPNVAAQSNAEAADPVAENKPTKAAGVKRPAETQSNTEVVDSVAENSKPTKVAGVKRPAEAQSNAEVDSVIDSVVDSVAENSKPTKVAGVKRPAETQSNSEIVESVAENSKPTKVAGVKRPAEAQSNAEVVDSVGENIKPTKVAGVKRPAETQSNSEIVDSVAENNKPVKIASVIRPVETTSNPSEVENVMAPALSTRPVDDQPVKVSEVTEVPLAATTVSLKLSTYQTVDDEPINVAESHYQAEHNEEVADDDTSQILDHEPAVADMILQVINNSNIASNVPYQPLVINEPLASDTMFQTQNSDEPSSEDETPYQTVNNGVIISETVAQEVNEIPLVTQQTMDAEANKEPGTVYQTVHNDDDMAESQAVNDGTLMTQESMETEVNNVPSIGEVIYQTVNNDDVMTAMQSETVNDGPFVTQQSVDAGIINEPSLSDAVNNDPLMSQALAQMVNDGQLVTQQTVNNIPSIGEVVYQTINNDDKTQSQLQNDAMQQTGINDVPSVGEVVYESVNDNENTQVGNDSPLVTFQSVQSEANDQSNFSETVNNNGVTVETQSEIMDDGPIIMQQNVETDVNNEPLPDETAYQTINNGAIISETSSQLADDGQLATQQTMVSNSEPPSSVQTVAQYITNRPAVGQSQYVTEHPLTIVTETSVKVVQNVIITKPSRPLVNFPQEIVNSGSNEKVSPANNVKDSTAANGGNLPNVEEENNEQDQVATDDQSSSTQVDNGEATNGNTNLEKPGNVQETVNSETNIPSQVQNNKNEEENEKEEQETEEAAEEEQEAEEEEGEEEQEEEEENDDDDDKKTNNNNNSNEDGGNKEENTQETTTNNEETVHSTLSAVTENESVNMSESTMQNESTKTPVSDNVATVTEKDAMQTNGNTENEKPDTTVDYQQSIVEIQSNTESLNTITVETVTDGTGAYEEGTDKVEAITQNNKEEEEDEDDDDDVGVDVDVDLDTDDIVGVDLGLDDEDDEEETNTKNKPDGNAQIKQDDEEEDDDILEDILDEDEDDNDDEKHKYDERKSDLPPLPAEINPILHQLASLSIGNSVRPPPTSGLSPISHYFRSSRVHRRMRLPPLEATT